MQLKRLFGEFTISEIKRFGEIRRIKFLSENTDIDSKLKSIVCNKEGFPYSMNNFFQVQYNKEPKYITSDKTGVYRSVFFQENSDLNIPELEKDFREIGSSYKLGTDFTGSYYSNNLLAKEMVVIFIISTLLLFFILAVQFESFMYPIIIMLTMPLGIFGAMFLLFVTGSNIDIMAAIGFIVVLGIVVDDPILKIEIINRLRTKYSNLGLAKNELVEKAIYEAGEICLKPLLMTSLTTSLALVPILFTSGIGADLQKPLVLVIIGGLTIGTFSTLLFIPLAYWYMATFRR